MLAKAGAAKYQSPGAAASANSGEKIKVKGYTKADGTKVPDHERTIPESEKLQSALGGAIGMMLDPILDAIKPPPAPTTAKGYAKMFDEQVSTTIWGGADVSISVGMPDGRRVWLYGDTLSEKNGFVHSTAITQREGRLHVSDDGKQLLPNGATKNGRQTIYWIETAKATGKNRLEITSAPTSIGTKNVWDFYRADKRSRVAIAEVDATGNVKFVKWKGYTKAPEISTDGEDVKVEGPNHYSYATVIHNIKLKNGNYLTTRAQNWDDPIENHIGPNGLRFKDWRPTFSESTPAEKLLWRIKNKRMPTT